MTKLIVKNYHELGKDIAGTNQMLANLCTKFWIIAAREVIRVWENECNECKRSDQSSDGSIAKNQIFSAILSV